MNLLYFIDGGFNNGVGSLFVEQAKAIHKQYKNIYVVTSSKEQEPNLIQSVKDDGISVICLDGLETHKNYNVHIKQLLDYIIKNNIQIVHVQSNWQLAIVTRVKFHLLFKQKLKIVYTIHSYRNNHPFKAVFARIMISLILFLFVDNIICTSKFLKKKFRILSYKIKLLPLGVSNSFFEEYNECKTDSLRLVFPAQFRIGKNQDVLIEAFTEYVEKSNDRKSVLYLLGNGELFNQAKEMVQRLDMGKQIFLPGRCRISDIKQYYKDSNIAVISSSSETFGYCIVEPFVLGRSVITRHVGIADDIIKDGVSGFFFNNKSELVNILIEISKNKDNLKMMGENNYKQRERFSWDIITAQYLKCLCVKY